MSGFGSSRKSRRNQTKCKNKKHTETVSSHFFFPFLTKPLSIFVNIIQWVNQRNVQQKLGFKKTKKKRKKRNKYLLHTCSDKIVYERFFFFQKWELNFMEQRTVEFIKKTKFKQIEERYTIYQIPVSTGNRIK